MASSSEFPILDFSKFHSDFDAFATELYAAGTKWGFFILTGTGIQGVDRMFDMSREFFNLPDNVKREKMLGEDSTGYDGSTLTSFAASEGLCFGLPAGEIMTTDSLPSWCDAQKRTEVETFKAQCYDLSNALMACFAVKLGLPRDFFLESHSHQAPGSTLKFIKYPRLDTQPDHIPRLSEHTDWGTMTLLFSSQSGLEVRDPQNNWCPVPVVENAVVVNIADVLALWSGKALKSVMHRITWDSVPVHKDRYSMTYFVNPNYDTVITSSDGDGEDKVTFQDYYKLRLRLAYNSIENSDLGEVDPAVLRVVQRLGVADAGGLKSNAVTV